jgi:hypothetical protein
MYHMISPTLFIFDRDENPITVYGWYQPSTPGAPLEPVVANPDGHGIGRWSTYYGEDPWTAS